MSLGSLLLALRWSLLGSLCQQGAVRLVACCDLRFAWRFVLRCVAAVVAAAAAVRAVGRWSLSLSAGVRAGPPVSHPARHTLAPGCWVGEKQKRLIMKDESDLANGEHRAF